MPRYRSLYAAISPPCPVGRGSGGRGFTLIEAAIVLVIFAAVMSVGAPSFMSVVSRNSAMAAESDFVGAVSYARSESMRRGVSVVVTPAVATQGISYANGWTIFADTNGDGVQEAGEPQLRTEPPAHTGVSFSSAAAIGFTPQGYITSGTTQSYKVCGSTTSVGYLVQVLPGGVIDVQDSATNSTITCP